MKTSLNTVGATLLSKSNQIFKSISHCFFKDVEVSRPIERIANAFFGENSLEKSKCVCPLQQTLKGDVWQPQPKHFQSFNDFQWIQLAFYKISSSLEWTKVTYCFQQQNVFLSQIHFLQLIFVESVVLEQNWFGRCGVHQYVCGSCQVGGLSWVYLCSRTNRDCRERNFINRSQLVVLSHNNWRTLPLRVSFMHSKGTGRHWNDENDDPKHPLDPVTLAIPKIIHAMNSAAAWKFN